MAQPRLTSITISLLVFLGGLLPAVLSAADEPPAGKDLFDAYSTAYFAQRSLDLEREMAQSEYFVVWLYDAINTEVTQRQKEDWRSTLQAVSPPELEAVTDSLFLPPTGLEDAPLRIKYQAWESLELNEFYATYYRARTIKDQLIASATSAQKMRMFRHDLESTLYTYRDGFLSDAVLKFTELIDLYGYSNVSDLRFYRGECFFGLRLLDWAAKDFQTVVDAQDPDYTVRALERLIIIAGDGNQSKEMSSRWESYRQLTGASMGDTFWRVQNMVAQYYFAMGDWDRAAELFYEIPVESDYYGASRLQLGDCYLAQFKLDEAEESYLNLVGVEDKKLRKRLEGLQRDVSLKLGYLEYLRGEFEQALVELQQVGGTDDLAQKADVLGAWCWFRLQAYNQVRESCQGILDRYPQTAHYYEIYSLLGYANEVLGDPDAATTSYQAVMSAMDSRGDYHDFNYERGAVLEAQMTLKLLEPALFYEGQREYFDTYISLLQRLDRLGRQIKFTEGIQTSPKVREILEERNQVQALMRENADLYKNILAGEDVKLAGSAEALSDQLSELQYQLTGGMQFYLNRKSLIQREEAGRFQALLADTVSATMRNEWNFADRGLDRVRELKPQVAASGNPDLLFTLAGIELDLMAVKDQIMSVSRELKDAPIEQVDSQIDHWSWFAYRRHCSDCAKFDDFRLREERLNDLDAYINRINEIIAERRARMKEEKVLPEELQLASQPGEAPYMAPPARMWKPPQPETPPAPMPTDTTGMMPMDTTGMMPMDTTGLVPEETPEAEEIIPEPSGEETAPEEIGESMQEPEQAEPLQEEEQTEPAAESEQMEPEPQPEGAQPEMEPEPEMEPPSGESGEAMEPVAEPEPQQEGEAEMEVQPAPEEEPAEEGVGAAEQPPEEPTPENP